MAQLRLIIGAFQDGPMDLDSSKVGGDEPWISYQETSQIVVRLEGWRRRVRKRRAQACTSLAERDRSIASGNQGVPMCDYTTNEGRHFQHLIWRQSVSICSSAPPCAAFLLSHSGCKDFIEQHPQVSCRSESGGLSSNDAGADIRRITGDEDLRFPSETYQREPCLAYVQPQLLVPNHKAF
jgi:hypothetical protein